VSQVVRCRGGPIPRNSSTTCHSLGPQTPSALPRQLAHRRRWAKHRRLSKPLPSQGGPSTVSPSDSVHGLNLHSSLASPAWVGLVLTQLGNVEADLRPGPLITTNLIDSVASAQATYGATKAGDC